MSCELRENVTWSIDKNKINSILCNPKKGLLYSKVEHAGEIFFNNYNCKNDICDKELTKLTIHNGNSDSVLTPLSVINFHTHPLSCYIEGHTVWGWPSGEDLKECINFAQKGNLTHIIFAVEGTYIIDVNKKLLEILKNEKMKKSIEKLFQYTHKYRMYYNEEPYVLEDEFNTLYLKPLGLKMKDNMLLSWLHLVNNLDLSMLNKLLTKFKINKSKLNNNNNNKSKIYNITFIPNKTVQWSKLSKEQIFEKLNKTSIILPKKIIYSAPFISKDCKL